VRQQRTHGLSAKPAEIEVEVVVHRNELADVDVSRAFTQAFRRMAAGGVIVAGHVEAAQGRGQLEGGEVVGRETGGHGQARQSGFEREHGLDAFAGGEDP